MGCRGCSREGGGGGGVSCCSAALVTVTVTAEEALANEAVTAPAVLLVGTASKEVGASNKRSCFFPVSSLSSSRENSRTLFSFQDMIAFFRSLSVLQGTFATTTSIGITSHFFYFSR